MSPWRTQYGEVSDSGKIKRSNGLFLDCALILAAAVISFSYLVELEAVCLIDIATDRARLVAEALQSEVEYPK